MKINDLNIQSVYLYPGKLYIAEKPSVVSTVLGSCVSLTLFAKRFGMGGICHAFMPRCNSMHECRVGNRCIECFKYVDCSVRYMLNSFKTRGIKNSELEVKLFGGADILLSSSSSSIGTANIEAAIEVVRAEKLCIVSADVGDFFARKLIYHTHTGDVYLKRLKGDIDTKRQPRHLSQGASK